uniref:Uncharacterized protein n=1 Tax=Oryza brachyantha TaxID=4533 RepID=J3LRP2_ORYBR
MARAAQSWGGGPSRRDTDDDGEGAGAVRVVAWRRRSARRLRPELATATMGAGAAPGAGVAHCLARFSSENFLLGGVAHLSNSSSFFFRHHFPCLSTGLHRSKTAQHAHPGVGDPEAVHQLEDVARPPGCLGEQLLLHLPIQQRQWRPLHAPNQGTQQRLLLGRSDALGSTAIGYILDFSFASRYACFSYGLLDAMFQSLDEHAALFLIR